jgi:rod shape-determining protein MreB
LLAAFENSVAESADLSLVRKQPLTSSGNPITNQGSLFEWPFKSVFSLFSSDLAIDLGTANTLVYAKGRGIVVSEPSIVAINKVTNAVEAVGRDAKEMLGRTPGNIVAIRPMKDGVIANFEVTEKMLQHFIRKAHNGKTWVSRASSSEFLLRSPRSNVARWKILHIAQRLRKFISLKKHGRRDRRRPAITEPHGNMVVDIGGGTTDIAVISLSGIVYSRSVRVAGNEMDEAITQYIKRKYNLADRRAHRGSDQDRIGFGVSAR